MRKKTIEGVKKQKSSGKFKLALNPMSEPTSSNVKPQFNSTFEIKSVVDSIWAKYDDDGNG